MQHCRGAVEQLPSVAAAGVGEAAAKAAKKRVAARVARVNIVKEVKER